MANKFERPGRNSGTSRRESRRYKFSSGHDAGGANKIEDKPAPQSFSPNKENTLEQPKAHAIDQAATANFKAADKAEAQKQKLDEIVDRIEAARKRNPIIQKNLEQQAERLKQIIAGKNELEKAGKKKRQEYNPKRQAELENQ